MMSGEEISERVLVTGNEPPDQVAISCWACHVPELYLLDDYESRPGVDAPSTIS